MQLETTWRAAICFVAKEHCIFSQCIGGQQSLVIYLSAHTAKHAAFKLLTAFGLITFGCVKRI
jgi:hypothetical protein